MSPQDAALVAALLLIAWAAHLIEQWMDHHR